LQRVEKTCRDRFIARFEFLCCLEIGDGCVELFIVAQEFGTFEQCCDVLRLVCENAIECCFRAGLVAARFLRECQRDPRGCGRVGNRGRAFGKVERFSRVARAQPNIGEQTQRDSVLFVDRQCLAKLLFGFSVAFATHQQCAECGVGK
jgi:hypothetical protein